ncbi:MAG: hypothetical protein FKY71_10595 [Spiribacter salinus]|uniref:Uncharacterized protein n=1 Tax=Spiribacter salinus TaxID=1335746 RepID=A0A540VQM4_9GAMM|nr:MAG: hypothetical protein FKY71_10595 [Spiribacter salinus]
MGLTDQERAEARRLLGTDAVGQLISDAASALRARLQATSAKDAERHHDKVQRRAGELRELLQGDQYAVAELLEAGLVESDQPYEALADLLDRIARVEAAAQRAGTRQRSNPAGGERRKQHREAIARLAVMKFREHRPEASKAEAQEFAEFVHDAAARRVDPQGYTLRVGESMRRAVEAVWSVRDRA